MKEEANYFAKLNDNSFDNIDISGSGDEENLSNGYQDTDYLTAVNDTQSTLQVAHPIKLGGCDSLSTNGLIKKQKNSNFQQSQSIQTNNESTNCSRRESFDMPIFPENQNEKTISQSDILINSD